MLSLLQRRLKSCLETILDVESDIEHYPLYNSLKSEMEVLKKYLNDVESLELSEEDVLRLEQAATLFLNEIYLPLDKNAAQNDKSRVLQ